MDTTIQFREDREVVAKALVLAKADGASLSTIMRQLLRRWLRESPPRDPILGPREVAPVDTDVVDESGGDDAA